MRGVILNELDILNNILNNNYLDKKRPLSSLRLLGKKYFSENKTKEEVFDLLNNYMLENYPDYVEDDWYGKIKGVIKGLQNYSNYNTINISEIIITQSEWDKILELNDKYLERLAFVLLVYEKIGEKKNPNSVGWVNQNVSDIFAESVLSKYKKEEKMKLLHELYKKNYISIKNSCNSTGIKLNYINQDSKEIITINNFENVVSYYYEYKNNEKWKECESCGKRYKAKNNDNKSKYCVTCRRKISNSISKESMRKMRKKKKC